MSLANQMNNSSKINEQAWVNFGAVFSLVIAIHFFRKR